ncbi:unnamed protein product [Durusdinium trenchii]|uniref:Uncharacterized protein n=1 Tax=Durusdinium trenchii TaxID=1381693 RepID=A0ABP0P2N2_9DINO
METANCSNLCSNCLSVCRPKARQRRALVRHLMLGASTWGNVSATHPLALVIILSAVWQAAGQNSTPCEVEEVEPILPFYASLPIIAFLVMLSGLFSGLTLGLMGLDVIGLQIVQKGDDKELARCAERIAPIRESGNQLLCTLLLGNVAVNSALSILTADIASGLIGFLVSTALIVVFGEILPQAACSRYALQVGARTVPIVKFLMILFFIITKPMSIILDWMLGREVGTIHSRTELMEMLKLQISLGAVSAEEGKIAQQVAEGALSFRDKQVGDIMTPLEDAYFLSSRTKLGYDAIREIFETGYSRIPIYGMDKHDYRGLLYTKDLMLADPEDEMKVGDFIQIFNRKVETFFEETKLVQCLNAFKKGGTHMGLVRKAITTVDTNPRFEIVGVLTLEDIVEEIIQEEIVDETDVYVDVDRRLKIGGRDTTNFNLGVFNPIWRSRGDKLSREEVNAISAHLMRTAFKSGGEYSLKYDTITWLVGEADVQNLTRHAPTGLDPADTDWIYRRGEVTHRCTLILQGRLGAIVGHESFHTDNGAFTLLARDALLPKPFKPDFDAYLSTPKVRVLSIKKDLFRRACDLDKDSTTLEAALKSQVLAPSLAKKRWTYSGREAVEDQSGSPHMSPHMSPTQSVKSRRPSQAISDILGRPTAL